MTIQVIRAAASLVSSAITCRVSGMWRVLRAHIEGRNAVNLERERRATLLAVPSALPPGTELEDLRADGSALRVRVPPVMRIDAVFHGNTEQNTPRIALPAPTCKAEIPSPGTPTPHRSRTNESS